MTILIYDIRRLEALINVIEEFKPPYQSKMKVNKLFDSFAQFKFWLPEDVWYMRLALDMAEQGAIVGEVPVGAVLVSRDISNESNNIGEYKRISEYKPSDKTFILAKGFNQPIGTNDPTAHAEIVALRHACLQLQNYRLPLNTTLYVTLEPCTMCLGALIHARLARVVFATYEPRSGVVGSQLNLTQRAFYNHRIKVSSGLLQSDSQQLLKNFFKARREANKKPKELVNNNE